MSLIEELKQLYTDKKRRDEEARVEAARIISPRAHKKAENIVLKCTRAAERGDYAWRKRIFYSNIGFYKQVVNALRRKGLEADCGRFRWPGAGNDYWIVVSGWADE